MMAKVHFAILTTAGGSTAIVMAESADGRDRRLASLLSFAGRTEGDPAISIENGAYDIATDDHYTKKTAIWCGNDFVMPPMATDPSLSGVAPDDRIHKAAPSAERANERSATPRGFARAVFNVNRDAERLAA